jgi:ATP dependent DNA ligase domain
MAGSDPHELVATLRPQEFGSKRPHDIRDALVEPAWPGVRVLAAVGGDRGSLWLDGEPFEDHEILRSALARATTAVDGAIFDGYLTKRVLSEGVGVKVGVYDYPTIGAQVSKFFIGGRRNRLDEIQKRREAEIEEASFGEDEVVNLVVVDLLWLDGQWLFDVPLLERKRILESVLSEEQLVRPGMFVRLPANSWIGSWRAQGFHGMTFKAANSRYRPGETANDWSAADMPRR